MKRKMNLQMFAEAVSGKKIVYLYRVKDNAATDDGTNIAFVTDNNRSISVDSESVVTKDGTIHTPGTPEIEIESTSILAKDDAIIGKLETAMLSNKLLQIWEANLDKPVTGQDDKFEGTYYEGYLTSFEKSSSAENYVECSLTFSINGKGAAGNVTVTQEQQDIAEYVFTDTPHTGA